MISLTLFGTSVLSHGDSSDCSEECKSNYCPTKDSKKIKINR